MVVNYKAHGKLLLTSEYAITQGAQGLAVPTKYGQKLNYISSDNNEYIRWDAKGENGKTWFWVEFDLDFKIIKTSDLKVASTLIKHLNIIRGKTAILDQPGVFTTTLDFPKVWGLGTSSTLMSLLAQCAEVDALSVFRVAHGGSGYDLACATAQTPIIYQLDGSTPVVKPLQSILILAMILGSYTAATNNLPRRAWIWSKRNLSSNTKLNALMTSPMPSFILVQC